MRIFLEFELYQDLDIFERMMKVHDLESIIEDFNNYLKNQENDSAEQIIFQWRKILENNA